MDTPTKTHTFVRTVKAQDLYFSQVDGVLLDIKTKNAPRWAILAFAVRTFYMEKRLVVALIDGWWYAQDPREKRNALKVIATGSGSISDRSAWPPELFSPTALCYGLTSVDVYDEEAAPSNVLSFCWKGRNIPIYLRTKYAEFNHVIRVRAYGQLWSCSS